MDAREAAKQDAARRAAEVVGNGMVVGLGSGSTAEHAIRALAERVSAGLRMRGVTTSARSEALARAIGIPVVSLADVSGIDVTIDGADEVDPRGRMIKGQGGALLREKIVACASQSLVIAIDDSKRVDVLGAAPLPIEIARFAAPAVDRWLREQGGRPTLRRDARTRRPVVTDEGHWIIDCAWGRIDDPEALAARLDRRVGIVEHGLFLGFDPLLVVGRASATTTGLRRRRQAG